MLKDNTKSLISTAFGHYINDGSLNIFPILYPLLLLQPYNFTLNMIGITQASLNGFSIVASPFIGRKSDVGRNYVTLIVIGVLMIAVGLIGFTLSMLYFRGLELFFAIIPFALVAGFGSSFYHPLGAAILNEQWDRRNRGRAMGINGSMGAFGILSFPIIAVALISAFGIASVSLLGLLGLVLAAVIFFLMRNVHFGSKARVLQGSTDAKQEIGLTSAQQTASGQLTRRGSIPMKLVVAPILALTFSTFIRSFFSQGIISFLPVYLTKVDNVQYSYVAIAAAAMPAMGMISQPLFGYLADRFGRRLNYAISTVGSILAMFVFASTTNIIIAEVALAAFGLFQFTGFPLILALAIEIAPKESTTLANSIVWGIGNIGGATAGPFALGLLAGSALLGSLTPAFFGMAAIGLIALVFVPFIPRPRRSD